MSAWFQKGQRVIVNGAGVGKIVKVGPPGVYAGDASEQNRYYRVNFGSTKCGECGRPKSDLKWVLALHITLCVGERL